MTLDPAAHRILDFERSWWQRPETKADAIRSELGCSPTTYYARLAELVDRDDALAVDPLLVRRLRRERAARRRARFEGPQRERGQL